MPSLMTDRINGLGGNLAIKAPVNAVATENITLSGAQTINGVAVTDGHRVLVMAQTTASQNGIYDVKSSGAWTRSADFDGARDIVPGTLVIGPPNGGTGNWLDDATAETVGEALWPATDEELTEGWTDLTLTNQHEPGNVLRYGAVGDGTTDDAVAIQAAIDAVDAGSGTRGKGEVYIPALTYRVGSTITVPIGVGIRAESGALFTTDTTGVLLDIYGDGQTGVRRLILPGIQKDGTAITGQPLWDSGVDTTSIGIQLNWLHYEQVQFGMIRNFHTGILLQSEEYDTFSKNIVCNTFMLGQTINCRKHIVFDADPSGTDWGVNQNTFIGGVCRNDGAWTTATGQVYIYMPNAENNHNTFIGTNLEDAASPRQAIYCVSRNNVFINTRHENGGNDSIVFTSASSKNTMITSLQNNDSTGPWNAKVDDTGAGNKYITDYGIQGRYFSMNFNDGKLYFGNASAAPAIPIHAYNTTIMQLGSSSTNGFRYFGAANQEVEEVTSGTTWPSFRNYIVLDLASPTNVVGSGSNSTDISTVVHVFSTNTNATLVHTGTPTNGRMVLTGGVNLPMTANQVVSFFVKDGVYYQI